MSIVLIAIVIAAVGAGLLTGGILYRWWFRRARSMDETHVSVTPIEGDRVKLYISAIDLSMTWRSADAYRIGELLIEYARVARKGAGGPTHEVPMHNVTARMN